MQAEGRNEGANDAGHNGRRRHASGVVDQAAESGRGGGWRLPGGQRSVTGKEVGSGCKLKVQQQRPILMEGGRRGETKLSKKRL